MSRRIHTGTPLFTSLTYSDTYAETVTKHFLDRLAAGLAKKTGKTAWIRLQFTRAGVSTCLSVCTKRFFVCISHCGSCSGHLQSYTRRVLLIHSFTVHVARLKSRR